MRHRAHWAAACLRAIFCKLRRRGRLSRFGKAGYRPVCKRLNSCRRTHEGPVGGRRNTSTRSSAAGAQARTCVTCVTPGMAQGNRPGADAARVQLNRPGGPMQSLWEWVQSGYKVGTFSSFFTWRDRVLGLFSRLEGPSYTDGNHHSPSLPRHARCIRLPEDPRQRADEQRRAPAYARRA